MANKQSIVNDLVEKIDISRKDAAIAVETVLTSIQDSVVKGEDVRLVDFGTFSKQLRAARKGRNPQTGEPIDIPESYAVKFKPGKHFKDLVK